MATRWPSGGERATSPGRSEPCWWGQRWGRSDGRFRLRSEVLAGVHEPVLLEAVLLVVQLAVATVLRQQLGVGPALDDLAAFDHQNLVSAADRRQAVGDHERGAAPAQGAESVLNRGFAFRVQARGGLVEDEDPRIGE